METTRTRRPLSNSTANNASTSNEPLAVQATVPALTPAQMYSNFEEWIKMCTDNKVNATNTWTFALIDYFHEMTFIREGDSINFQKASCTLDGCVKIYTSRVDSVATETGKLLSGLADSSNADDDDSRQPTERRVRRKTQRSEATLLKDFSSISLKKFDLDFTVDPLFKKTSADFDEGGARGLLLNHLGIDQQCKIIFDASDATVECELEELDGEHTTIEHIEANEQAAAESEEEQESDEEAEDEEVENKEAENEEEGTAEKNTAEGEAEDEVMLDAPETTKEDAEDQIMTENNQDQPMTDNKPENETSKEEEDKRIEIFRLKAKLPKMEALSEFHIVPFLKGYDFFSDNFTIPDLEHDEDEEDMAPPAREESMAPVGADAFQFDDDFDFGGDDIDPFNDTPFDSNQPHEDEEDEIEAPPKSFEHDFLSALMTSGEHDMFDYFDSTLVKNWAGPEHWKLRRPPTQKKQSADPSQDAGQQNRRKSRTTEVFWLPFKEIKEDEENDVFEKSSRKPLMGKDTIQKMTEHLLPNDIQFSSKLLLQYSLKPAIPKKTRHRRLDAVKSLVDKEQPKEQEQDNEGGIASADIEFWAEQTQDYMDDAPDFDSGMPMDDDIQLDQTMLTAFEDTSFYHDNYDDPEVSVLYGDELITHHTLKKTKPLYVNYARTAKRVDIKKLKDNLWKVLTSHHQDEKVQGEQKFSDIVHHLKKLYPPKAMRDISVPFCFICLLHLANEKDLSIRGPMIDEDDDFVLGEQQDWMKDEAILSEVTIVQNE